MAVCGAYSICPYPTGGKFIRVEVRFYPGNEIITIFSDTRVGAYCIRPTNGHANGRMDGKIDGVLVRFYSGNQKSDRNWIHPATGVAVCGAYAVAPYTNDLKNADFSICSTTVMVACRAYSIRPYPTGQKFIRVLVRFYLGNQKSDRNWIHPASGMAVCGAYAVAPYTGDLKNGDFPIRSVSGVAVCRAYAVAPYTGDLKNGDFSIHSTTGVAVCGAYAIRPYPVGRKFIGGLVRFYSGNQKSDRN